MNTRLQKIYDDIRASNHEAYLNNDVVIDKKWAKPIWGITLQIDLADEVKDKIENYQHDLNRLEPGNFYLLPREYQHISFNQVVFWDGDYAKGPRATWQGIETDFIKRFEELDNKYKCFEITFSHLIPTKEGIIWCANDTHDTMEVLRNEFQIKLPFPPETTKLNHIVHTTVVRHKNTLTNPRAVIDYSLEHTEAVSMEVKKIILKKELVFPSIKMETISEISLVG